MGLTVVLAPSTYLHTRKILIPIHLLALLHLKIRVSARYHFLDDWRGETAFAKLDKNFLWTHTTPASPSAGGINMCGNPAFPEHRFSTPIDVVLSHAEKDVTIAFGLEGHNEAQAKRSACDRSFGVDDVMVYVR